jgi:amino acid adenylation domain-containing protein
MTTVEFLADITARNVRVWVEKGNLRCRAAKGVLTPQIQQELARRKAEIVELLAERPVALAAAGPQLRAVPRDGAVPLSFAQERLWFLYQLEPESTAYNIVAAIDFQEPLDQNAVNRTITEIVRRHETLRTTFASPDGQPVPIIAAAEAMTVPVRDLRSLPAAARREEFDRVKAAEVREPFDLARGPLMRVTVLQSGEREWELLVAQHHIVTDRWSLGVLVAEIQTLYRDFASGRASSLSEPPIQYADFAAWQRERMNGELLDAQLAYWRERLVGDPPTLDLPLDRPRPPIQTYNGTWLTRQLQGSTSQTIRRVCREERVTPFMVLLAGFSALLHRYTGQQDILVGSPIAGRTNPMLEGLVGCFVNTLVLRTDLSGAPTFGELLGRVREVALGAYSHADVPFEKLVADLHPRRDMSRSPLFHVALALQSVPKAAEVSGAVSTITSVGSLFDLTLFIVDAPDGFHVTAEYNTDLFDGVTIERLLAHYELLLAAAMNGLDRPIARLPLLTAGERRQLLEEWNDCSGAFTATDPLHVLFEAQVALRPDAVAASYDHEAVSYAQLNARANQLAHRLLACGVGPDRLVALALERSTDLVVAILAVLKAGGAYLPLDTSYPADRFAFMLEDAGPVAMVTSETLLDSLPPVTVPMVCMERDRSALEALPTTNPHVSVGADNLAYSIYTSGSTGRPKGVLVTHRNVARLLSATDRWFSFGAEDVWTLFHSFAFDFSVWELWGALAYGGRLVVVPYWVSRSAEAFHELLQRERVTVLNQTPSAFRQLIEADAVAPADSLALRLVIFGGEALDLGSLCAWVDRHGDGRPQLVNMYGITETTVHVTYRPITIADIEANRGSVIGVPIPDLQVHLLSADGELVPVGAAGEMFVGGAGVARGYLNRPELSSQRFVADPFNPRGGARLYRSGDLARRLATGELVYLGRIDHQVKIRGYRIELGEVEAALAAHPHVKDVLVLAFEAAPGDKRLVAYYVSRLGEGLTAFELRTFLENSLPKHMLPSFYVALDSMPLTVNGKIDRRALPAPFEGVARRDDRIAPRTPMEHRIAAIWHDVLGVDGIGVHDNFFDVGGHSLLSMRVIARIEQETGVRLHPRLMFLENLEQIAAGCERRASSAADATTRPGGAGSVSV